MSVFWLVVTPVDQNIHQITELEENDMGIDWEEILGTTHHLQEAYDDMVMDACLEMMDGNDDACDRDYIPAGDREQHTLTQEPEDDLFTGDEPYDESLPADLWGSCDDTGEMPF